MVFSVKNIFNCTHLENPIGPEFLLLADLWGGGGGGGGGNQI